MISGVIPARLSVVTLGAADLPSLRRFYLSMGWQERPDSDDGFASFLLGGVLLALYPADLLQAEAAPDLAPRPPGTWNGVTLALNVDSRHEVDRVFSEAVGAGARSVAEPQDRDWGGRSGYISDPEGNRWEVAWAPGLAFDGRGAVVGLIPTGA
ncbi:MAG: glyoxalase [Actinobacteria bacterium]|nr:MAG: glyoxalase [Actinomycetota bacterium]